MPRPRSRRRSISSMPGRGLCRGLEDLDVADIMAVLKTPLRQCRCTRWISDTVDDLGSRCAGRHCPRPGTITCPLSRSQPASMCTSPPPMPGRDGLMPKLEERELTAILAAEKRDALSADQAARLSEEREKGMDYYNGDMKADMPAQPDRSKAVSSDVLDTVEGLMPGLMEIFCGGDEVVRFNPVSEEDEPKAAAGDRLHQPRLPAAERRLHHHLFVHQGRASVAKTASSRSTGRRRRTGRRRPSTTSRTMSMRCLWRTPRSRSSSTPSIRRKHRRQCCPRCHADRATSVRHGAGDARRAGRSRRRTSRSARRARSASCRPSGITNGTRSDRRSLRPLGRRRGCL